MRQIYGSNTEPRSNHFSVHFKRRHQKIRLNHFHINGNACTVFVYRVCIWAAQSEQEKNNTNVMKDSFKMGRRGVKSENMTN